MSVNERMTAIADAIRGKTGGTEKLTFDDMAVEIPKVYDAGKKSQYDELWDKLQGNATRTNYTRMFSNFAWNDDMFKPKYDFVASTMYQCFMDNTSITALDKKADGTVLVFDGSTISTSTGFQRAFYGMTALTGIGKIISISGAPWTDAFKSCSKLADIMFEGEIGQDIDFSACSKLTSESITGKLATEEQIANGKNLTHMIGDQVYYWYGGILGALKDFSGTDTTKTIKFNANSAISNIPSYFLDQTQAKGWSVSY